MCTLTFSDLFISEENHRSKAINLFPLKIRQRGDKKAVYIYQNCEADVMNGKTFAVISTEVLILYLQAYLVRAIEESGW